MIMVDLAGDMAPLLELDADALRERLYTPRAELGDLPAAPIKLVHLNKCPVLAQANTLRPLDADRLGISIQRCLENAQLLRANPQVREKVVAVYAEAEPFVPSENVDAQLYNGFFSDADRAAMKIVLETEPRNLPALDITFADKRIERLLFNYRARNFPGTLDEHEQQRWLEHRRQVFTPEFLQAYADELQMLYQQYADDKEKLAQLKARCGSTHRILSDWLTFPGLRLTPYPGYKLYQQYADDKEKLAQLKALWQYAQDIV